MKTKFILLAKESEAIIQRKNAIRIQRPFMEYINDLRKYVGHKPLLMVGATVLILDSENQLLMLKRCDNNAWGVPGGAMELGESFEDTAKRETLEETGLEVGEMTLFGVFSGPELYYRYPNGDEVYNAAVVYLTRDARGEIKLNDGEHREFRYFELSKLPEQISPPIKPIIRKIIETFK